MEMVQEKGTAEVAGERLDFPGALFSLGEPLVFSLAGCLDTRPWAGIGQP